MLEFVDKLLKSQDNIIDQLKLLKENKKNKEVKKYMKALVKMNLSPYYKYCIDKYYYDLDIEEVKPTAKSLNIILHPIIFHSIEKKQEKIIKRKTLKASKKVKKGDIVKILNGPYKDMTGIVESFDKNTMKLNVIINMFGLDISCECKDAFEIIKEDKNEKKD